MDVTRIQHSVFYRHQHVTCPECVLGSVRFGKSPPSGPPVIRLFAMNRTESALQFELANHVSEILAGVARANAERGTGLEAKAIEVAPDDYPEKGQAEHAAYQIALAVGRGVL